MKEIGFINLSKEKSKELHIDIFKNAKSLKNDSLTLVAENASYSSASSLLILSSEEIIKSILTLLHSNGYQVYLLKDAKRFFFDHSIRHSLQMLIEAGMSLFESVEKWDQRNIDKRVTVTKSKNFNMFLRFISDAAFVFSNASMAISRIEGITKFNDLKNAGFYVDYKNKIMSPSQTVSKADYESIEITHKRLEKFYKQLRILFHPSITKHLSLKEEKNIKELLHTFINDALKDFSFKDINNIK